MAPSICIYLEIVSVCFCVVAAEHGLFQNNTLFIILFFTNQLFSFCLVLYYFLKNELTYKFYHFFFKLFHLNSKPSSCLLYGSYIAVLLNPVIYQLPISTCRCSSSFSLYSLSLYTYTYTCVCVMCCYSLLKYLPVVV